MSTPLSLAELSAFDPGYHAGTEQRYCCPLPACAGKERNRAHRSLAVNTRTGAWHCHRCGESGLLREHWTRTEPSRRQDLLAVIHRTGAPAASTAAPRPAAVPAEKAGWRQHLNGLQPYMPQEESGVLMLDRPSPAAAYLRSRGLDPAFPFLCEVKYAPDWYGRGPAVVFPLTNGDGETVALQGRYLDPADGVKCRTARRWEEERHHGLFLTCNVFAPEQKLLLLTEAPIDTLSLLQFGFVGAALCGVENPLPAWFLPRCRGKRVVLAFDNDRDPAVRERVGQAEARLAEKIAGAGGAPFRFRPPGNFKDWNDGLQALGFRELQRCLMQELRA